MKKEITNNQLAELITGLDNRFGGLETRFDGLETRFDGLETRFDGLETRFGGLETRFDGLETRFDDLMFCVNQGFDEQDKKISDIQKQVRINQHKITQNGDAVANLTRHVDMEFASHRSRFERIENHCGI